MRRLALIALLSSCTFEAPRSTFDGSTDGGPQDVPNKGDGGGELDGGDRDGALDTGVDGGVNRPPRAIIAPHERGIPWDTIQLDGSGSQDPDGDAIAYVWTILSAPSLAGGFAPFPGTSSTTAPAPAFYAPLAGEYLVQLEISDGLATSSTTTAIVISSFQPIPTPQGPPTEVVALAISGTRLFMGAKMHGGQVFDLRTRTSSAIDCITDDKINDIAIGPDAEAYYGFDDAATVIATDGTNCSSFDLDEGPTKVKDIEFAGNEFYVATDRDVYGWTGDFTEYVMDVLGNDAKYSAVAWIGSMLWLGSDEAGGKDGAILTTAPPTLDSPLVNFFPGDDKVTAIAEGERGETWIASSQGIVFVPDTATPTVALTFNAGGIPLPLTVPMLAIAHDRTTGDLFFANQHGVARYKRDVGVIVAIPQGTSGLSAGDVRTIAVSNHTLFVGNQNGAFIVR